MGIDDKKREVLSWIDKNRDEILNYLSKLISFNSGNPPGLEMEVQNFLKEDLVSNIGFDEVDYFAVDKEGKRPNNVAIKKGTGGGRDIIINGHIDVSAVSDELAKKWTYDPWKGTIKDGRMYGRGSSDMKGGINAAIWAVKSLIGNDIGLKGSIFLETVVGEEGIKSEHELGTTAACKRGYKAPIAIVPEPSDCEIFVDQSGVIGWDIYLPGKPTHVANKNVTRHPQRTGMPMSSDVGVNAMLKGVKIINALEELEAQWIMRPRKGAWGSGGIPNHDNQGVGMWTNSLVAVEAGDFNVWAIAGHCKLRGVTYYPPWVKEKEVIDELWATIKSLGETDDWIKEQIEAKRLTFNPRIFEYWGPTSVPMDHELVETMSNSFKDATGREATLSGSRYVSDATYLGLQGIPAIIFGPGDINYGAHGIDEFVPINEVINCAKTIALTLIDWCQV